MSGPYFLALDAGSGSGRAVVFDAAGRQVGVGQREWIHRGDPAFPGALDFDCTANGTLLDDVTRAAISAAGIKPSEIKAISTTSMREGSVWFDVDGNALWACPNIDSRAVVEAAELAKDGSAAKIFEIAGDWVSITTAARVRWIARHRPDILKRTAKIGMISDWAAMRLTGRLVTEPSAGSSTGLFDLSRRSWSEDLFDLLGLDRAICPDVVESGEVTGAVTKAAAERTGLVAGTPVVAGGGDTQLALIGLGRKVGDSTLVGGTFWQMTQVIDRPIIDPGRGPRTLCHARPDQWMIEGIGFLTGHSLRWLRNAFFEDMPADSVYDEMVRLASEVPVGANGVRAVISSRMKSDDWIHASPTLYGFGVTDGGLTGRAAVVRAVMESGAYVANVHRQMVEAATGIRANEILFSGGGAKSALWPQIISDVMNMPVHVAEVAESTALGCAILAAIGSGHYRDLDDAAPMTSGVARSFTPDPGRAETYFKLQAEWQKVDQALTDLADQGLTQPMWEAAGRLHLRNKRA